MENDSRMARRIHKKNETFMHVVLAIFLGIVFSFQLLGYIKAVGRESHDVILNDSSNVTTVTIDRDVAESVQYTKINGGVEE